LTPLFERAAKVGPCDVCWPYHIQLPCLTIALAEELRADSVSRIMGEAVSPHISIDRDAVSAFCRRHHIRRLALFGSVLRDDFGPDSDIDVLVEFQPGHVPGLDFVRIEREFSQFLGGRRVEMITPKSLSPRIRDQILTSAEPLYSAGSLPG
jgi:hypothetical protein